jgi:hypothetical protein
METNRQTQRAGAAGLVLSVLRARWAHASREGRDYCAERHFFARATFWGRLKDFTEYSSLDAADRFSDAVKATSRAGRWARTYADPFPSLCAWIRR